MQSRYDQYEDDGNSSENNPEIIFTTYAEVEAEIGSVFGASSQYGESLGVNYEEVELVDGCLYYDGDKDKYKLFSWQESNDLSPEDRYEKSGEVPTADDASDFITKTYFGKTKEYELAAARVPEVTDEDGDVVFEASSKVREVQGGGEFGEWEDLGEDRVPLGDFLSWHDGNDEYGPGVVARELSETLTQYGEDAVTSEDDIHNWLADTSGDNVLREDLEGRRVRFFIIRKEGDDNPYNLPVVEDLSTGEQIKPNNRQQEGGTGNSDSAIGESDAVQEAAELDAQSYPEPIANFISSGKGLDLTEERAVTLLTELIQDDDNALTSEMVTEHGGREVLVNQVT